MFRVYMHALRFTRMQSKVLKLQTTQHTREDRTVLQVPTHTRTGTQPLLFKPTHSKTLLGRTPKPLRPPVAPTRNKRV